MSVAKVQRDTWKFNNERYGAKGVVGAELTPEQLEYNTMMEEINKLQARSSKDVKSLQLAFLPRANVDPDILNKQRFISAGDVDLLWLQVIPTSNWEKNYGYRRYRFNLCQTSFWRDSNTGELGVGCDPDTGAQPPYGYIEADLNYGPKKDHPNFNVLGVSAGEPQQLTAPEYGDVRLSRNKLHVDLFIANKLTFRFMADDVEAGRVKLLVNELQSVTIGAPVADIDGAEYGVTQQDPTRSGRHISINRINGDVLSVDRHTPTFVVANALLRQMLDTTQGLCRPMVTGMWMPTAYAYFDREVFNRQLRASPSWRVSDALAGATLEAVGPEGNLYIRAIAAGEITDVKTIGNLQTITIKRDDGSTVSQSVPAVGTLRKVSGRVELDEALGDYCPRVYYDSYEAFEQCVDGHAAWLVYKTLQLHAIDASVVELPGILIETRYVGAVVDKAEDIYLDFSLMRKAGYYNVARKALIGPPVNQNQWDDLYYFVRDVHYHFSPLGKGYITPQEFRANRQAAKQEHRMKRGNSQQPLEEIEQRA